MNDNLYRYTERKHVILTNVIITHYSLLLKDFYETVQNEQ